MRPSRLVPLSSLLALLATTGLAQAPPQTQTQTFPFGLYNQPVKRYAAPDYTTGGPGGAGMKPPLCQPGWSQGECLLNPAGEAWPADRPAVFSGGAMTHDGGLLFLTAGDTLLHDPEEHGLYVTAMHLDRVTVDSATG